MCIRNEPRKSRKQYATRHKEICKLPKVLEINPGTLPQQHSLITHQANSPAPKIYYLSACSW